MPKKIGETKYYETSFGIIPRSKLIPLEIEGIKKAWDYLLKERKSGIIKLEAGFVKKLHKIGYGWIFPEHGGKFRKEDVKVSDHNPPKGYLIPQLMENLMKDIQERIKHLPDLNDNIFLDRLIELLAYSHHKFLWIHPFFDYNGRIGRLLINMILLNLDLPPVDLKIESELNRKKYIKALQFADNGNYEKIEKLIKKSFLEAIN